MNLSETEKNRIRGLVEKITKHSIGSEIPHGFCFSTSYALSIYFKIKELKHSIKGGKFKKIDHFWLSLDEYKDVIVDATIKQFDENQYPIYIGTKNNNEITKQYVQEDHSFNDWCDLYKTWCEPLLDENYTISRPQELKEKVVFNTFIAASILNSEIEQMNSKIEFIRSYRYKFYFEPIYKGLSEKWSKNKKLINKLQNKLPDEFNRFLTKVMR